MKKMILILVACFAFSSASCSKTELETPTPEFNWKIGLITNTADQNEEEYHSAQQIVAKYGEDKAVHLTWPSHFMWEPKYIIPIFARLGEDPDIKAIIISEAVSGTDAAIDELRKVREDIFIVHCTPRENLEEAANRANLILMPDELMMGPNMVQQAHKMGAKVFVHYSFQRHMKQDILSKRRDLISNECETLGIKFVDATAPDPTSDVGVIGTHQFILEDVPKMIAKHGNDTAFFATNCATQIPLIKVAAELGTIYPQPCCPSPSHGFYAAFDLVRDNSGYFDGKWYSHKEWYSPQSIRDLTQKVKQIIAEKGSYGRLSTWPVSGAMMSIAVGTDYAIKWINGEVPKEGIDSDILEECMSDYAGTPAALRPFEDENGTVYDNFQLFLLDYITY